MPSTYTATCHCGAVEVAATQRHGAVQVNVAGRQADFWSSSRCVRQRRQTQLGCLLLVEEAHCHSHIITDRGSRTTRGN